MTNRAGAHGPVRAGSCAALALLVTVVSLLCLFGRVGHGEPLVQPAAAERAHAAVASEASDASPSPCGRKTIAEHSVQRAESAPPAAGCPDHAVARTGAAAVPAQAPVTWSGGPAPPPPTSLHSVLRI